MSQMFLLSEENQALQSKNRKLRERLLELYLQINTLSVISDDLDISQKKISFSPSNLDDFSFVKSEHKILSTGAIYSAAVSPSSDLTALASINGDLTILTTNLKHVSTLKAHSLSCRDVYWGKSGLFSCGFDKFIKIWDLETQKSQDIQTGGLCHQVCGTDLDLSSIFCATGSSCLWFDKRRQTPLKISNDSPITSVTTFQNLIIYGGYDGKIYSVDKRSLHSGPLWSLNLNGGSISSLSKFLNTGQCIITTTKSQPVLLEINNDIKTTILGYESPMRFGCRADITEKNLIFGSDFSTVCGGRMASFCSGLSDVYIFEDVSGFDYGGIFLSDLGQKVLTYSEDGVISIWTIKQS